MKRLLQLVAGLVLVVGGVGALVLLVASLVIGKWLDPAYLEAEIEQQLTCEVEIESVERRLFGFGPARVELGNLTIKPSAEALQRLKEQDAEPARLELLAGLLDEPVIEVDRAELLLDRSALFSGRVEVVSILVDQPRIRIVDVAGLGSSLDALVPPKKPKPDSQAAPRPEVKPEEKEPTVIVFDQVEISDASVDFTLVNPDPDDGDPPLLVRFSEFDLNIADFSTAGSAPLEVPFSLSGRLMVQESDSRELARLDLDGDGLLSWGDGVERELARAEWEMDLVVGSESFLWGGEIIAQFKESLREWSGYLETASVVAGRPEEDLRDVLGTDWELPERGVFEAGQKLVLAGQGGERVELRRPLTVYFDEAWFRIEEKSWLSFEDETDHRVQALLRPPEELAAEAWSRWPRLLDHFHLGSLWPNFRDAWFVDQELLLPLASEGSIDDFGFDTEPEFSEMVDAGDVLGGFLDGLLGGSSSDDRENEEKEDSANGAE